MIFKILANYGPLLLAAMGQTLLLALWSLFFACLIGLFVGILSVLKSRVCNIIATIFVDIIRGVPMIVLAFFVYFGVPMLMNDNLNWAAMTGSKFTFTALQAGIICLSLNCGAYMAEIIRAGIESAFAKDSSFFNLFTTMCRASITVLPVIISCSTVPWCPRA